LNPSHYLKSLDEVRWENIVLRNPPEIDTFAKAESDQGIVFGIILKRADRFSVSIKG